jgi:phosphate-selective porin OprO/OprP
MFQGEIAKGIAAYQLGIFNGTTDGGSDDAEVSDGDKDVAARVFFKPFLNSKSEGLRGFGFGVAGTAGRQKGAPRGYSTPGQQRFFSYLSGAGTSAATANVNADGTHLRLVPQASYYWGPFGIYGEYAISDQELSRSAGGPLTYKRVQNTAWQVTGSYFLTDDQNSFGQIVPKKPVDFSGNGGWGAWELVAQVSGIDLDKKAFPLFASSATSASSALTWGIGLNWYLNRNVKIQAGYERTDFEGGKGSILNQKGENVLLTRIQLAF